MSDKNFEEKLKKHWREEADSIPVPDTKSFLKLFLRNNV